LSVEDRLAEYLLKKPQISSSAFVVNNATVVGDVTIKDNASVWYQAVLRGDINRISIGKCSNIQDGVIGHLSDDYPLVVGDYVTVGHGAVLHACTIED
jgi:carbonic anhydrase/acetyltransferase-like protein (isoleucine patch superfamily)